MSCVYFVFVAVRMEEVLTHSAAEMWQGSAADAFAEHSVWI